MSVLKILKNKSLLVTSSTLKPGFGASLKGK